MKRFPCFFSCLYRRVKIFVWPNIFMAFSDIFLLLAQIQSVSFCFPVLPVNGKRHFSMFVLFDLFKDYKQKNKNLR